MARLAELMEFPQEAWAAGFARSEFDRLSARPRETGRTGAES